LGTTKSFDWLHLPAASSTHGPTAGEEPDFFGQQSLSWQEAG